VKTPTFNKLSTCIYTRVMLLRYFTYVCLVHILIHYSTCNVATHELSVDQITEFKCMTTNVVHVVRRNLRTTWL